MLALGQIDNGFPSRPGASFLGHNGLFGTELVSVRTVTSRVVTVL